jgi:hypothetical protein
VGHVSGTGPIKRVDAVFKVHEVVRTDGVRAPAAVPSLPDDPIAAMSVPLASVLVTTPRGIWLAVPRPAVKSETSILAKRMAKALIRNDSKSNALSCMSSIDTLTRREEYFQAPRSTVSFRQVCEAELRRSG